MSSPNALRDTLEEDEAGELQAATGLPGVGSQTEPQRKRQGRSTCTDPETRRGPLAPGCSARSLAWVRRVRDFTEPPAARMRLVHTAPEARACCGLHRGRAAEGQPIWTLRSLEVQPAPL